MPDLKTGGRKSRGFESHPLRHAIPAILILAALLSGRVESISGQSYSDVAKNGTTSVRVGTFGFDSQIPVGATITNVTVSVEWKVSTIDSIATLGSQVYVGGVARGTELVNTAEPTSDTVQTYTVSGLTRADLLDGTFEVQVRASRGNSNTVVTASLDAVTVTVDYTTGGGAGTAPVYDDNGNMTSDGSYGNRSYAYDTLGRLASVTSGGSTTSYSLDGAGNRWSQTTGAVSTAFDLDLSQPNPTNLADGTAKFLPGMPNAGYSAGGTWYNAITDLVGSPVTYVDTAGTTSGLTHYDPYGAPRPGSTAGTGIGFAGEYRDATGLVNLQARSYDPVLGRFIGRDTFAGVASAPQTGNRYAYALANPLRFTDPSGHFVQSVIANPGEALSTLVSFTAIPGLAHAGLSAVLGFDPISGRVLSAEERTFLGVAVAAIPGARAVKAILGRAWGVVRESALVQRVTAFGSRLLRRADGLPLAGPTASPTAQSQRLSRLLAGVEPGVNVTPRSVATRHGAIGRYETGTYVTDPKAFEDVIGALVGPRMQISSSQARSLEAAVGLNAYSLERVNIISIVKDVRRRGPASPMTGNVQFLGPGLGLPGGAPELTVRSIPSVGGADIEQIILEVLTGQ